MPCERNARSVDFCAHRGKSTNVKMILSMNNGREKESEKRAGSRLSAPITTGKKNLHYTYCEWANVAKGLEIVNRRRRQICFVSFHFR